MKELLKVDHIISGISIVIAIISLCLSYHFSKVSNDLNLKYNRLSTYSSALSYSIDIDYKSDSFTFGRVRTSGGRISVTPKVGGISKVYAVHYQRNNVKAILPIELYSSNILNETDPQNQVYVLSDYTIDSIASTSDYNFGTLFIVIQDYSNNYYTNMITYKVSQSDPQNVMCTVYNQIDLLYCLNEDLQQIPDFDFNQMQEYRSLVEKLEQILL